MRCPNCEGFIVYPSGLDGEKICSNCGLVIDDVPVSQAFTQLTPEWHSNWNEEDSQTLREWLTTLRAVSCQLNIPNFPFREEVARTIRTNNKIFFKSQKLSKDKRTTVAALIHLVLKQYNKLRPIKEISNELSLDHAAVTKKVWILNKSLTSKEKKPLRIQRKTASDYLHTYAVELTSDKQIIQSAEITLTKVKRSGGNPVGLAAGAFYCACKAKKAKISKEEIGKVFHISDRTVYTNEARIRKLMRCAVPIVTAIMCIATV